MNNFSSVIAILICGVVSAEAQTLDPKESISPDPKFRSELAKMNTAWIKTFVRDHPDLAIFSLTPRLSPNTDYQDFEVTYFSEDSKQTTLILRYMRFNNSWRDRPTLVDPDSVRANNTE